MAKYSYMRLFLRKFSSKLLLLLSGIIWVFFSFQSKPIPQRAANNITQDTIKANALKQAAETLFSTAQYLEAVERLETAKTIFQKYKRWESVVFCVVRQSFIADNLEASIKRNYATKALSLAKKHLSKNNFQLGKAYQQIAEVQVTYEAYDSSIASFNQAIHIFEQQKKWTDYAWATISKSVNYYYLGKYDLFKTELHKAQRVYEKYDGLDEEIYIATLDLLAVAYSSEGDFDKAIENTKNSIQFYLNKQRLSQSDSSFIATNYMNISSTYNQMGAFQLSNSYLLKAINFSKGVNQDDYTTALYFICADAYNNENHHKSIQYGHLCIKASKQIIRKKQIPINTSVYGNIGSSYLNLAQYDSSEFYLKKAISLPDNEFSADAQITYARLLLVQNKVDEALVILHKIRRKKALTAHSASMLYLYLGQAYGKKRNFEQSMLFLQRSLHQTLPSFTDTLNVYANPKEFTHIENPLFLLVKLNNKARNLASFSEKQQNLEAALATYDLAIQWIDTLLQSYAYDDVILILNQNNRETYEQAIDVANQLYLRTNDKKYIDKAFTYSEKIKSNILLASLQSTENKKSIPKSVQSREKDLAANVAFYERQLQTARDNKEKEKIKLYQNYLTDYRINLGNLKDSIRENYSKYYELKYSTVLATIPSIQADLTAEQGFISYYTGDSATYVFTIARSAVDFAKVEKTAIIDEQVFAFRKKLEQPKNEEAIALFKNYNLAANRLYETVLANSLKQFPQNIRQLIIIPDGTLNYIPFEILTQTIVEKPSQDFSKMPYLLYHFQIQYGYSATLLKENKKRQNRLKTNDNCLAFAPPYQNNLPITKSDARETLRDGITQLQGTSKEIQAIAAHFDGDFDEGETATKANFLKAAPDFGILHLAMHGEANYENERFANLKFTNTKNQSKEDYLLYQSEIANMDLNAQLVVLSACETGLGKYVYGEGIASLGRSFMYAGVPSVVMSLWKVDDKATSQLMPYFYENLAAGMPKDKALHQAKLTFLQKEDFSKLHPHYWAGFVSIGDIQPIKQQKNGLYWLLFGGLSIFAFGIKFFIQKNKK